MEDKDANFVACSKFRAVVADWIKWVEESKERCMKRLEIAMTKPDGLHHDSNLIMDENGKVWRRNARTPNYEELTRDAPFEEYRPTGDTMMSQGAYNGGRFMNCGIQFVAKGWDEGQMEKDWAWVPDRHNCSTRSYYIAVLRSDDLGLMLGKALMAIDVERLDEWVSNRASMSKVLVSETGSRKRDNHNDDWNIFTQVFALIKDRDVPDNGSVHAALSSMIDKAVPGGVDTIYMY